MRTVRTRRRPTATPAEAAPQNRRYTRFIVKLPARCARLSARATDAWRGWTANVSPGGLAVELTKRMPPSTAVAVEIRTGIGPIRLEAKVLWTRRVAHGAGLVRHGLCLANRSELLDLPVGVLLGQWLKQRAKRESGLAPRARNRVGGTA